MENATRNSGIEPPAKDAGKAHSERPRRTYVFFRDEVNAISYPKLRLKRLDSALENAEKIR